MKKAEMGSKKESENLLAALQTWFNSQSVKKQACQALVAIICLLLTLIYVIFADYWALYIAANFIRVCGISVLIYKLTKKKTCSGLSLKSQELTAICFAVTIYVNAWPSNHIRGLSVYDCVSITMDLFGLVTTIWVIYIIRFKLRSTYMEDVDNLPIYYLLLPCALLALLTHPLTHSLFPFSPLNRVLAAFLPYLEAVMVLPQLRVMQSSRVVEAFTAFYVFALGAERVFKFALWLMVTWRGIVTGAITAHLNFGFFLFLVAEVAESFILADFVYHYLKVVSSGRMLMHLPTIVVEQSPV